MARNVKERRQAATSRSFKLHHTSLTRSADESRPELRVVHESPSTVLLDHPDRARPHSDLAAMLRTGHYKPTLPQRTSSICCTNGETSLDVEGSSQANSAAHPSIPFETSVSEDGYRSGRHSGPNHCNNQNSPAELKTGPTDWADSQSRMN